MYYQQVLTKMIYYKKIIYLNLTIQVMNKNLLLIKMDIILLRLGVHKVAQLGILTLVDMVDIQKEQLLYLKMINYISM